VKRNLSLLLLLIFLPSIYFFFFATPVQADWFQDLKDALTHTSGTNLDILGKLDRHNRSILPLIGITPISQPTTTPAARQAATQSQGSVQATTQSSGNSSALDNAATGYTVACGATGCEPTPVPQDVGSFFAQWLGDLLGIRDAGNVEALRFANSKVPPNVAENTLALWGRDTSQLAQGSETSNVLGFPVGVDPMTNAYAFRECDALPHSVCPELVAQLYTPPTATPTPSPSRTPTPTLPSVPTGGPPIVGICPAGTGKCAPSYIESVLVKDLNIPPSQIPPGSIQNASQICMKESGGDPFALNDSCLEPNAAYRTRDYSVGLFQINLLVSSRCPGALRDNWPQSCTILDRTKLEECVGTYDPATRTYVNGIYTNPVKNIEFAWNLSGGGLNWKPWSAASVCKIYNPLPTPSVPVPVAGGLIYYSQRASPWAQLPFDRLYYPPTPTPPQQCTVQRAACGPVTVAMILSTYVDRSYTPEKVINDFYPNQPSCLSSMGQAIAIFKRFGFRADPIYSAAEPGQPLTTFVKDQMRTYIQNGSQIMAGANINGIGHFFWITEVTPDGRIMVMDPWYGYDPIFQRPRAIPMDQDLIKDRNGYPAQKLYKTIWAFHL